MYHSGDHVRAYFSSVTMGARSPTPRSACSGPRGRKVRAPRRRKSGSETPKLQSMSYGDVQTLRSVFPAPLRDARLPLQRSQLLRLLARHGLKFWSLRPRLPTAKWSQFLSPWPGTCRTQHRISFDHRSTPQLSLFICRAGSPWREGGRLVDRHRGEAPPHTHRARGANHRRFLRVSQIGAIGAIGRSARSDDRTKPVGRTANRRRTRPMGFSQRGQSGQFRQ